MKIKTHNAVCIPQQNSDAIVVETKISPIVELRFSDVQDRTMGQEAAQIRVLKDDKYVNFWVGVSVNSRNQIVCEVSTNAGATTRRKSVTAGKWRDNFLTELAR